MKHVRRTLFVCFTALGCARTVAAGGPAGADASVGADARAVTDAPLAQDVSSREEIPTADAGAVISDDCARGTWCWERPVPTGERAVGARAFSLTQVVYVTRGGTVARWDGLGQTTWWWRTARPSLPARVTGFWAENIDTLYLTCMSDNAPGTVPRRWLVRVDGERATVVSGPQAGSAEGLVGSNPNDLWALGGRALLHWDGTAWTEVPSPGDVLLTGLYSVGPGEVLALESWGSGSGYGVLHRHRAGVWTPLTGFRPLRARVEGPIVFAEGALWLRAWDVAQSRAEVVRVDPESGAAALITPPTDESGLLLHAVGGALWATNGTRAWDRIDGRWTPVVNLPSGYNPVFAGTSSADAWFFGDVVAHRATDGWRAVDGGSLASDGRTWGMALQGVAGFWRDADPLPALVSVRPGALAMQDPADRARWPLRRFVSGEGLQGWTPVGNDGGWMADAVGVVRVRGRFDAGRVDWPDGVRRAGPFGGWSDALWMVSARGIERYVDRRWLDPVAIPRVAEAPGETPQVMTVHGVSHDTAVVATTLTTGDKRVFVRVLALRGGAFTELAALRGTLGSSTEVRVAGALPAVWIAFDGLRRWDGERLSTVEPEVTPLDVHALPDGGAAGVDDGRVYVWSAQGARVATRTVPRADELRFQHVRAGADGTLRVAASGGQVMRFTP